MPAWQGNTQYRVGDLVTNGGNTYVCSQGGQSGDPATGATGPTGAGSGITDGGVIWAYYPVAEADSQAFVVYVPPSGTDTTVESCLRLGAGPPQGAVSDETTTYNDVVHRADPMTHLSPSYHTSSGIALLTPGAINLVAAGGVNTTSGVFSNNSVASSTSNIGSTYTVTIDPSSHHVISASYTTNGPGTWSTWSFNQAATVSINTVPLQASIAIAPSYAISGPLTLSNNYGLSWSSNFGFSVTAQVAKVINIGWRTIVSNCVDGSNNAYYTSSQASSTAAQFKWAVPVRANYLSFDTAQEVFCKVTGIATMVTDALAVVYAAVGLGIANNGTPSGVQSWLSDAEGIAIACTALNGVLAAMGVVLGFWVDGKTDDDNSANNEASAVFIKSGRIELKTKTEAAAAAGAPPAPFIAPALTLDASTTQIVLSIANPDTAPRLKLAEASASLKGKQGKGKIEMNDNCLIIGFGDDVKITLNASGITMEAPGHSVTVANNRVAIAGNNVTIEGLSSAINSLNLQVQANTTGLHDEIHARTQAVQQEHDAREEAEQAEVRAREAAVRAEARAREAADRAINSRLGTP